jgi:ubiquinone/menaquinone biosynthesis C-methylase UbiE
MKSGLTILDVGAGSGFLTLELAQRCGAGTTVIAVDPWKAATTRLRKKLAGLGLGNVVVLEKSMEAANLAPGSVDVIVSNLGVNNFDDVDTVMRLLFVAAKPGAGVFLTTNLMGHMAEFYEVFRATLIEVGLNEVLDALETHVRHRGTVESLEGMFRAAGFETMDVETTSFRMRFADGSALLRHHFIRMGFVPAWVSLVPAERVEDTFGVLERNLNRVAAERGELALTIPVACVEARRPLAG